jgi:hypothetical protein
LCWQNWKKVKYFWKFSSCKINNFSEILLEACTRPKEIFTQLDDQFIFARKFLCIFKQAIFLILFTHVKIWLIIEIVSKFNSNKRNKNLIFSQISSANLQIIVSISSPKRPFSNDSHTHSSPSHLVAISSIIQAANKRQKT